MADYPTLVPDAQYQADQQSQFQKYASQLGSPVDKYLQDQQNKFQQVASQLTAKLNDTMQNVQTKAQQAVQSSQPAAGDIAGWRNVIASQLPEQYRDNADLVNTILAGGMAESGLNPTRMQQGGNGVGFWQFDTGGGMGTGVPLDQLKDEAYQASRIIPQYIQAWENAPAGLSPAEKASWVAAQAERPYDYTNPNSTARRNYANAYNVVTGGATSGGSPYQGAASAAADEGANRSAGPSAGASDQSPLAQFQAFAASLGDPVDNALAKAKAQLQQDSQGAMQTAQTAASDVGNTVDQARQTANNLLGQGEQTTAQVGQDLSNTLDTAGSDVSNAVAPVKQAIANMPTEVNNAVQSGLNTASTLGQDALNTANQAGQAYTNEADKLNATVSPAYAPQAEQQREQEAASSPQAMLDFQTQNIGNFPQFLQKYVADPVLGSLYGGIESAGQALTGGQQRPFEQNLPSDPAQAALALGQRWAQGQDVSQLPREQQGLANIAHTAADLMNPAWQAIPTPGLTVRPTDEAGATGDIRQLAQNVLDRAEGTTTEQAALRPTEPGDAANILLSKFPTDVQPYLQDVANQFSEFAGARRGVITDQQAMQNAAQTATSKSIEDWLKVQPGQALNQEQVIALGQTLTHVGQEFDGLSQQVQQARAAGNLTPAMEAALADKALQFGALAAVRSGATAEAGRALRAFRTALDGSAASREGAINRAFQALGTDPQHFADWVSAWNMTPADDFAGRYRLLQSLSKPNLIDKALAFGMSNILSSTKTAEIVAGHGAIMTLNRPLLTLIRASPAEALTDVAAMGRAIGGAWSNAVEAFLTGVGPTTAQARLAGDFGEVHPEAFPGKQGLIATPSLRIINAMHEFNRTLSTAGALAVAARREGVSTGRSVQDLLANPTPSMLNFAQQAAEDAVSGGKPSPIASLILQGRNLIHGDNPAEVATGAVFHILAPFVRIPDYLYRNGLKILTGPVYYPATAAYHVARGEGAQAGSDARMWGVVTALDAAIFSQALAGNITGSGPRDPAKQKLLTEARDENGNPVWQPHSLRIGGRWYDYTTLAGPLTVPLAAISSAVEAYRMEGLKNPIHQDFAKAVAANTFQSLMDASYIKTMGDIFKSLQEGNPPAALSSVVANTAERAVPLGSLLAEGARSIDPGVKAPDNVAQTIEGRVPFLSQNVPNQVTPFGQPQTAPQDVLSTLSPSRSQAPGQPDPVSQEVARLQLAGQNVAVHVVPSGQQKAGGTFAGAKQTAEQMRALQASMGQQAHAQLASIINQPAYQKLDDAGKAKALNDALRLANSQRVVDVNMGDAISRDPKHQAVQAWNQVPHYEGVAGSPQQIETKNLAIAEAKAKLAQYEQKYKTRDLAAYHLMKDDKKAWQLAQRAIVDPAYLKMKKDRIDKQYNGALTQAASEGLLGAGQTLVPIGSGS